MFKKLFAGLAGVSGASSAAAEMSTPPGPYKESSANLIYQLLFCDRPELFRNSTTANEPSPWHTLFQNPPDNDALSKLAEDPKAESRVRALAFNALRAAKKQVPAKILLGTIIEVPLDGGLDTLAVFTDGGVRYLNQSGKMAIVEDFATCRKEIETVIAASKPIVATIGPWDKARRPPPSPGNIRMTFLVSDGLYFGEGPLRLMQKDPMAAPLINAATALLLKLTDQTVKPSS